MDHFMLLLVPLLTFFLALIFPLAVTRLIFSERTVRIAGLRFGGYLPDLFHKLATGTADHLIPKMKGLVKPSPDSFEKLDPLIDRHLDEFLKIKLPVSMPYISHFISDRTLDTLKSMFREELQRIFPEVMEELGKSQFGDQQVRSLIAGQLASIPISTIKEKIRPAIRRARVQVLLASGIIGLLVALLQWLLLKNLIS